jgi:hypothetical protein
MMQRRSWSPAILVAAANCSTVASSSWLQGWADGPKAGSREHYETQASGVADSSTLPP